MINIQSDGAVTGQIGFALLLSTAQTWAIIHTVASKRVLYTSCKNNLVRGMMSFGTNIRTGIVPGLIAFVVSGKLKLDYNKPTQQNKSHRINDYRSIQHGFRAFGPTHPC